MMTQKPDRFERMVMRLVNSDSTYDPFIYYDDVVALLRREHRAMVKIVQKELDFFEGSKLGHNEYGRKCRVAQCHDILTKLQKRAK